MKRFKSVNLSIQSKKINELIFENAKKAKNSGFGGLRETGFEKVKSSFFTFVFLCGGDINYYNSRDLLSNILKKNKNVKLIISENLEKFKGNLDLLTFETILEAISKMILIPVESYGTACELGAFTRINDEDNKVVAILNTKYKDDRSFINFGPIELLKQMKCQRVITATFSNKGQKTYLLTNSEIDSLYNHPLLVNPIKISKYYVQKNISTSGYITDLNSFLIAALDYLCLVGFTNIDMLIDFFSSLINDDNFEINTHLMKKGNEYVREIISCFLHILESIGFLTITNDLFFVNSQVLVSQTQSGERWIGKVLFTNSFTRTDEYLKIKSSCEEIKSRIIQYGYY